MKNKIDFNTKNLPFIQGRTQKKKKTEQQQQQKNKVGNCCAVQKIELNETRVYSLKKQEREFNLKRTRTIYCVNAQKSQIQPKESHESK